MGRKVTLSRIAEELGLSTATISLALRDSPLVAETTRDRIKLAASEMGYIYDRRAASLRTARSDIVGVLIHTVINPFFAEILRSIEEELALTRRTFLLCNHGDSLEKQRSFVSTLMQFGADGVIMCPSVGTDADEIRRIEDFGLPVTLVARTVEDAPVPCIRGDDRTGAALAGKHLFSLGHKRVAIIGGKATTSTGRMRLAGYRDAFEEAGISYDPALRFETEGTRKAAFDACYSMLESGERPDAIAAFNDIAAFGVLACLQHFGLTPGKDISVIGYDNLEEARISYPALSTVDNGQDKVGGLAAQTLLQRIISGPGDRQERLIEPQLVIRATCCEL
ncbi:MAG: LacI family DNA-binding transcriptional regulator [Pseudomonadota bacterium]